MKKRQRYISKGGIIQLDVIILDFTILLLVLVPILYFTIKMAVKHAIQEVLASKKDIKLDTDK